ncbi:uncharacterized protein MELLADRAFT_71168 [Melampsora larici-populina 98AG31]|uniref:SGNH hydrolase-type esterase domain-containing protein n=1 Tax=Melampsora larici-populina (strain 98AG31 / pathotype 3-4-7) TaxID=747676 RepID=F4RCX4_MELLP|nr:uncharacterized protein MELLADRAFT_71168 [Melampsora larici-populina 98AG31]EGG09914.1 hypothetical protein MELLADRAFT_71168 [Melampsora larici-populina 98AG31]
MVNNKTQAKPIVMDELVMFGDSITQQAWQAGGTGSFLANQYQRKLDVVNRGYSGYNTIWALQVAKRLYPCQESSGRVFAKKKLVTIWLGANDAVLQNRPQHVEAQQYTANLKQLIKIFRDHDIATAPGPPTQIILITPPPISVSLRAADLASRFPDWTPADMDRDVDRTASFADHVKNLAAEEGLPVLDTWTALTNAAERSEHGLADYLCDGLHLTPAGYEIISNKLMSIIETQRPDLLPENLPQDFPPWKDINPDDPEGSFPPSLKHDEL